ncbi:MAG: hypothetical protein OEM97_00575 [Acidimicrobiia bacterium]|nr:hypothetical protein [Acidimicrobiia bacterium]
MKPSQIVAVLAAAVALVLVWRAQKPQPPQPEAGIWEPTADVGDGRGR